MAVDSVEQAIRNALARGDAEDRGFRERVYRSAFESLDRAMERNPAITPEMAGQRRDALKAKVARIESEFLPARHEAPEPPFADEIDTGYEAPRLDPSDRPGPNWGDDDAFGDDEHATAGTAPRRARRRFAVAFVASTVIAAAGIAAWWAYETGLVTGPGEYDLAVPNPPQVLEDEEFTPDESPARPAIPGSEDARDWVAVFTPEDPARVDAPAGAGAELMDEDGESFMRIRSGDGGAAVRFDIGRGLLESLAGRGAVFAVDARSQEGETTQIAVDCDFDALGDCERKRYDVGQTRSDFLFEVAFPDGTPEGGGTIAIDTGLDGGGGTVDVFGIRVAVTD